MPARSRDGVRGERRVGRTIASDIDIDIDIASSVRDLVGGQGRFVSGTLPLSARQLTP
jgi:hypothetical protein